MSSSAGSTLQRFRSICSTHLTAVKDLFDTVIQLANGCILGPTPFDYPASADCAADDLVADEPSTCCSRASWEYCLHYLTAATLDLMGCLPFDSALDRLASFLCLWVGLAIFEMEPGWTSLFSKGWLVTSGAGCGASCFKAWRDRSKKREEMAEKQKQLRAADALHAAPTTELQAQVQQHVVDVQEEEEQALLAEARSDEVDEQPPPPPPPPHEEPQQAANEVVADQLPQPEEERAPLSQPIPEEKSEAHRVHAAEAEAEPAATRGVNAPAVELPPPPVAVQFSALLALPPPAPAHSSERSLRQCHCSLLHSSALWTTPQPKRRKTWQRSSTEANKTLQPHYNAGASADANQRSCCYLDRLSAHQATGSERRSVAVTVDAPRERPHSLPPSLVSQHPPPPRSNHSLTHYAPVLPPANYHSTHRNHPVRPPLPTSSTRLRDRNVSTFHWPTAHGAMLSTAAALQ